MCHACACLGVNAIFHDPSAALVIDGEIVAAAEEERFSRRKHGKRPVPFSAWELPELAMRLVPGRRPGCGPGDLDAVAYSFDPALARPAEDMGLSDPWDHLRTDLRRARPGVPRRPRCPAWTRTGCGSCRITSRTPRRPALAAPHRAAPCWCSTAAANVRPTWPAGTSTAGCEILASQELPHSLGLVYESLTEHLGFLRSSDEYKVMALASYGRPRFLEELRELIRADGRRRVRRRAGPTGTRWRQPRIDDGTWGGAHADLACSRAAPAGGGAGGPGPLAARADR